MRNTLRAWMEGHVTVTIRGKRLERLINLAVRDGLDIWNIRRLGPETGQCDIVIRDFFRLRKILRETGCKVHVERRTGLPFWFVVMRRRSGFVLGALLFFFGLYMLSGIVWSVEVVGNQRIPEAAVLEAAHKVGLKEGAWKFRLKNPHTLSRELHRLLPETSWVIVDIHGIKAKVTVVEKTEMEKKKAVGPQHLVARKRAVIHRVLAESGKVLVSPNQFVEKGQVLVSGILGTEQRQGLTAAKGKVEGEVWYISEVSIPLVRTTYEYTGERQKRFSLLAGSYAIQVWPFVLEPFDRYEVEEETVMLGYKQFQVPIGIKQETLLRMEKRVSRRTVEEAIGMAKVFARRDLLAKAGEDARIKDEKVLHVKEENGKVYLKIHYAVIENIAQELPIVALPQQPGDGSSQTN